MAHRGIPVVSAEYHLVTFRDYAAAVIESRVDSRLSSALADRLDLRDRVGEFHESLSAREEVSLKVRAKSEAKHW